MRSGEVSEDERRALCLKRGAQRLEPRAFVPLSRTRHIHIKGPQLITVRSRGRAREPSKDPLAYGRLLIIAKIVVDRKRKTCLRHK